MSDYQPGDRVMVLRGYSAEVLGFDVRRGWHVRLDLYPDVPDYYFPSSQLEMLEPAASNVVDEWD